MPEKPSDREAAWRSAPSRAIARSWSVHPRFRGFPVELPGIEPAPEKAVSCENMHIDHGK
jgi:hypothetical protein